MFSGTGAEAVCANPSLERGYAIANGAGASLTLTNNAPARRTITARDVAFPLEDAFSPVTRARVPVPGLNHWPGRYNRLGRKYYGLSAGVDAKTSAKLEKAFTKPSGFAGLGASPFEGGYGNVDWLGNVGLPPVAVTTPPISGSPGSNFSWDKLFGGIFSALPGTIGAITGNYDPLNRTPGPQYMATQLQSYGQPPEGYYYDSSGRLIKNAVNNVTDFITENPLLIGGAILGAVLLFMRPPGRR